MTLHADICVRQDGFELRCALEVRRGETVAVVGRNGAGKTTLLRAIAGLRSVDAGYISLDGAALDEPARGRWVPPERRSAGVVFQDLRLFPHLTAVDNVAFGLRARGTRRREAQLRATAWLARVGLAHRAGAGAMSLSGGESQRVSLARALAVEPRLLLLDEPLASVDASARPALQALIREQLRAHDGVRLLVTHDAGEARMLADRVVTLEEGRVLGQYPP